MSKIKIMLSKKKNVIITASLLVAVIFIAIIGTIFYPFTKVSKQMAIEKKAIEFPDKYETYQIIQCEFDLKNPEYAFVDEKVFNDISYYEVMFYNLSRPSIFSQSWTIEYNGGTDIYNTDFDSIASLAKSDCNQFRQGYPSTTNPKRGDLPDDIRWVYYSPPTDEEIKQQEGQKQQQEASVEEITKHYNSLFEGTGYTQQETLDIITSRLPTDDEMEYIEGFWDRYDKEYLKYTKEDMQEWVNFVIEYKNSGS